MQATTLGPNRTGAALAPAALEAMNEAATALSPPPDLSLSALAAGKAVYIGEAEAVGSVPMPETAKGLAKTGLALIQGGAPDLLIDKLGERLAFERSSTRLYEALIAKYQASMSTGANPLTPVGPPDGAAGTVPEAPMDILVRIREEELAHFHLLQRAVLHLGGDPTAQTPCADVAAVASTGIMQVLNDPRTTLAQCLNAMLTAEMTDNAGWELLIRLADAAGQTDMVRQFTTALLDERSHLEIIQTWLNMLMTTPLQAGKAI